MIDAIKNQKIVKRISIRNLFAKSGRKLKPDMHLLKRRLTIKRIEFFAQFRYMLQKPYKSIRLMAARLKSKRVLYTLGFTLALVLISTFIFVFPVSTLVAREPVMEFPDDDLSSLLLEYAHPEYESFSENEFVEINPEDFEELELFTYTVKSGETISEIAIRYGLRMDTLISLNQISDVRRIWAGATIQIPSRDGLLYTVQQGDSLDTIGQKHSCSVNSLVDANNLQSEVISKGQTLFVPGARMSNYELKKALGELFIYPTRGRLTSYFGFRNNPFTGVRQFHNGVDLANRAGTNIYASLGGTVKSVAVHPTWGRYIIVSHIDGFQTWYAHLSSASVKAGQYVSQGQKLGEMGTTGYSTGNHLHFSIFRRGKPVDPLAYLN